MRMAALTLALTAGVLAVPSHAHAWGSVNGNGHKTTEQRTVPAFDAVSLRGALDVDVKVGPEQSVAVTIDSNLQPEVETRVDGSTLVISSRHSLDYDGVGKVTLTVPALRSLGISGSGDAVVSGVQGGDFNVAVSGSGDVRWEGRARHLDVAIEGSGDVKLSGGADFLKVTLSGSGEVVARELPVHSASVTVAGSGDVDLTLTGGTLDAQVAGSGDVHWSGQAQLGSISVAGSGKVARR